MKRSTSRLLSTLLVLCMVLALLPGTALAATVASGTCGSSGKNLTWNLDETGTLTIQGTGAMGSFENWSMPWLNYSEQIKTVVIKKGVTSVGNYAFYFCNSLTNVIISESVISIGDHAFAHCDSLTNVIIPESVTSIERYAFHECKSLTNINIPKGVTFIGDAAFGYCYGLTNINVAAENANYCSDDGIVFNIGKTILQIYPAAKTGTSYTIPESVTEIGAYAFSVCSNLTSVTIPEGVTSIGESSFSGCSGLTSVTIPESVTEIGAYAFATCDKLTSVSILNSDTSIGARAFLYTPWQENMGEFAVFNGVLLAYQGNGGDVIIPEGVTSVGGMAFWYCTDLTSVIIPKGVISIGYEAFWDCRGLTNVTIPSSVTVIEESAFELCDSLTDVYYGGSESQWKLIEIDNAWNRNDSLLKAKIHYNSPMPGTPDTPDTPDNPPTFTDVPAGAYYAEAVNWAVAQEITDGIGGNKFGSTNIVSRAQAVTFLWRAAGRPEPKSLTSRFADVTDTSQWYYKAVLWAAEQEITDGTGYGMFGINDTLPYDQMLTFMCRAAGVDTSGDWSGKAIRWAESNGLTNGLTYSAYDDCPRCDVVYILWKELA